MLPAFHGERMRSYEPIVEEIVDAEIDSWPLGEEFAAPPADAGGHPRGDPARRLRRHRRAAAGAAARPARAACWPRPPRRRLSCASWSTQPLRRRATRCGASRSGCGEIDELLYAEIAERRAEAGPRGARRHPLGADPGPLRGRRGDERHRAARPADDAAARRPRDDRDGARLDLRPAAAPPRRRCARLRDSLEAGEDDYLRATITESLRLRPVVPLAGRRLAKELVADGLTLPAGTDVTPGDLARPHPRRRLPRALRLPARALPRGRPRDLRLDPLRRRRAPLHRRRLRRVRDADRAARGADPLRAAQGRPAARAGRASQRHALAPRRDAGRPRRPPPGARAPAWSQPAAALFAAALAIGCSRAQRAIAPEPEITSPSSRTRIGTSLVPLSALTSARSSSRLPQVQGNSR